MEERASSDYFPELTGIRAIAAYMVFIHHYNFITPDIFGHTAHGMAKELHIGVTMFFVLSGFLISYRYSDLNNFSFKTYITNRFARIYPIYFILTTLTYLNLVLGSHSFSSWNWKVYLLNITFLRGFFDDLKFTMVSQGWSLTVEETFYILAPLFFLLLRKTKNLAYLLIPFIVISISLLLYLIFKDIDFYGFFENPEFIFNYTFFGRVLEFTAGMVLAKMIKSGIGLPKGSFLFGLSVLLICLYGLFILQGNGLHDFGIRTNLGKLINTFILPFFAILPIFYSLVKNKSGFSKILASKPLMVLGKSSYVFSLIHMGVISTWIHNYITSNLLFKFLIIQALSIIIWHYLEEPFNNLIRKSIKNSFSYQARQVAN